MTNKIYLIIGVIIIGVALFLRINKMENRAPFDWDQNRDYKAISEIARGKATLIGPVAKGEGGFFLGPLYYYLATPAFIMMKSSPVALPITSIMLDVLAVAAILLLFRKVLGDYPSLILATLWSVSWFVIEMSRISWNVALVPLWSVVFLFLLSKTDDLSPKHFVSLGLVAGLSWHVHAALIPISLALLIFVWKVWAKNIKNISFVIIGYIIPLIPLVLFDLRHSGLNYHLLSQMFIAGTHTSVALPELLSATMMRLGKNTQAIFLGISSYNLVLGYVVTLIAFLGLFISKGIYRISSLIIVLNVLAVLALKEVGFPEYYFAASYIPTMIIFISLVSKIIMDRSTLLILITLILIYLNFQKYSYDETSFGLSRKMGVAKMIMDLNAPVDLSLDLAPGREGGILAFYKQYGGKIDAKSPIKIVVTDQSDGPIIWGGEFTSVIGNFGGIRVSKYVVQ